MVTGEPGEKISRRRTLKRGALVAGGAVLGIASAPTTAAEPTEIDRCASLTEPSEYVLTADLDAEGDCLALGAGVTLDGNGHAISGNGSGIGLSFEVGPDESAAVRDLRITDFGAGAWAGSAGGDITLEGVAVTDSSAGIRGGTETSITVRDSVVSDNSVGVGPGDGARVSITDSTLSGNRSAAMTADSGHRTELRRSTVRDNGAGIDTGAGTFVDNTVADNDGFGLRVTGRVAPEESGSTTIIGNEVRNNDGPGIEFASGGGTVRGNAIAGNRIGILLSGAAEAVADATPEYAFAANDIAGNEEFGLRNASERTAAATCNFWGDPTGPVAEESPAAAPDGDAIDGDVEFVPWAVEPVRGGDPVCLGGETIGDASAHPTDPDGDGRYEDVNGDGEVNADDAEALFANRDDELLRDHPDAFDFNDDGTVDALDAQALFDEVLNT